MAPKRILPLVLLALVAIPLRAQPTKIDFNRDVRPILSENCYYCHGPDKNKRKADLRLDTKSGLFDEIDKTRPVVPGHTDQSDLFRRITTSDADDKMPPAKSNKKLTADQISTLKQWIDQGAAWEGHWAYTPPKRLPAYDGKTSRIDALLGYKLAEQKIAPGGQTDTVTLCRRLYFDLLGLPPTPEQMQAFRSDSRPDAYERLVDSLLANPHFGERMAVSWLDQVRYADTIGYHSDNPMNVSPYRDWVITAFNQNMPFDEFTVEQLAGDLLPNPSTSQKVASCYNRLLQTTGEGGAQPKEYEAKYASDRVRNISAVWMAQTMGCCECHDHKFDPIATKEFYQMEAFFADIQEAAVAVREPGMPVPTSEEQARLRTLDSALAAARAKLNVPSPEFTSAEADWEKTSSAPVAWTNLDPSKLAVAGSAAKLIKEPDGVIRASGVAGATEDYLITAPLHAPQITGIRLEALADNSLPGHGPGLAANGNFVLTRFLPALIQADGKPQAIKIARAIADHSQDQWSVENLLAAQQTLDRNKGWAVLPQTGKPHIAIFTPASPIKLAANSSLSFTLNFQSVYPQHSIGKLRLSYTADADPTRGADQPPAVRDILAIAHEKRTPAQQASVVAYYRTIAPLLKPHREAVAKLEGERTGFVNSLPKCLVSISGPPRTVRVLARGNWLDTTGQVVSPGTPAAFGRFTPVDPKHPTRLDLARWIVSKDNPLTARVFVNRLWKDFCGSGIARKVDDFGSQGDWPTHPELLDYLAVDFMDHGWDIKRTIKQMVTTEAYRRTSVPTAYQLEKDPGNLYFSHQNRQRLDAEFVRDNALAISGLLVDKLGGASVYPYQPAGYWSFLNFPTREWQNDKGEGLYRRGLYTHWQRTFLQPSLLAFDAPSREEAVCERTKSNVPQQALAMLNDVTYVEASRVFAEHILTSGSTTSDRLEYAFRRALQRPPKPQEAQALSELLDKHLQDYSKDEADAKKLIAIGDAPRPADAKPVELAAWTNVARAILNLHETITRN